MTVTESEFGVKIECGRYIASKRVLEGGGWMLTVMHGGTCVMLNGFGEGDRLGCKLAWEFITLGMQRAAQLGAPGAEGAFGGADE